MSPETKNKRKTDIRNWKVVTFEGKELVLPKTIVNEETGAVNHVFVTRWDSYLTANRAARTLGGVAVRE